MRCSVIIPTRAGTGGPAPRCVESVRAQLGADDELIVSVDGAGTDVSANSDPCVRVVVGASGGPAIARNRALDIARGRVVLFLNDDVVARPGLLEAHLDAHARRADAGLGPAMVLGSAPWAVGDDDRVIDRLVRETSWIFFYDRMDGERPERDWGFRHAWTLNLSVPREIAGRFDERLRYPMFDDLEWAWRVAAGGRVPVLFRPGASVEHHHRYEPLALLRREVLLGHQANLLHALNPECAGATVGSRFLRSDTTDDAARDATGCVPSAALDAFRAFGEVATVDSGVFGPERCLSGVFEGCRVWREAARRFGSAQQAAGVSAGVAMDSAGALFGGRLAAAMGGVA